jgi:hypothetical protein
MNLIDGTVYQGTYCMYNYTEFIFARVLNYFRLDEQWEHITNIEKDFLSGYDYHYK